MDRLLNGWRVAVAAAVVLFIGVPLAMPVAGVLAHPAAWEAWGDIARFGTLAGNTAILAAGTLALTLPAGTLAAVLLYRTDLPGRAFFRFVTVMTLFVPLPLFASAWQAALGAGGWWAVPVWGNQSVWRPWPLGMGPAIWVHALAAFPWVVLIVGQGLRRVERPLEEDALLAARPGRVLARVTLVRSRGAIGAAALWVVVLTTTEITVTDVMQVRTFAEEVYTQLVMDDRAGVARGVALALPPALLTGLALGWAAARLSRTLPAAPETTYPPLVYPLGRARGPALAAAALAVGVLGGVPVTSLVWKAGLSGTPPAWSAATAGEHILRVFELRGAMIEESLRLAAEAGVLVAGLGLVVSWLATRGRWFFISVVAIMALAWTLPAPLVGLGLKEAIARLLDLTGSRLLAKVLYHGPSQAPVLWADAIRFFPFGVALLWPLVRLIPAELTEAARVDGARPGQVFALVIWPLSRGAWARTALAVGVLSLGELGAGKLVETPGPRILAHDIFEKMHYGVTNELAALCLVLLGLVAVGGAALAVVSHGWGRTANG